MSRAAVPTQPASRSTAAAVGALPSRLIATFSGPVGLALKIALLSTVNALAVWSLTTLASRDKWVPFIVLVVSTLALDWIYFMRRAVPLKFLIPGTIFLLGFQVIPVLYTVEVAFTNYSTGHVLEKSEAVTGIQGAALTQPANGRTYTMAPARSADGELVLVLADDEGGKTYIGTKDGLKPIPASGARQADNRPHRSDQWSQSDPSGRAGHRDRARARVAIRPGARSVREDQRRCRVP